MLVKPGCRSTAASHNRSAEHRRLRLALRPHQLARPAICTRRSSRARGNWPISIRRARSEDRNPGESRTPSWRSRQNLYRSTTWKFAVAADRNIRCVVAPTKAASGERIVEFPCQSGRRSAPRGCRMLMRRGSVRRQRRLSPATMAACSGSRNRVQIPDWLPIGSTLRTTRP